MWKIKKDNFVYKEENWKPLIYDKTRILIESKKYLISSHGRVYNKLSDIYPSIRSNREYRIVTLHEAELNVLKVTYRIHRLVALAFIPNPNKLPQVNHKSGYKDLNLSFKLEWSTGPDNIRHALIHKLRTSYFTIDQVHEICKLMEIPNWTFSSIIRHFDLEKDIKHNLYKLAIIHIYHKKAYLNISSQYKIVRHSNPKSKKVLYKIVHEICKLMEIPTWTYNSITLYIKNKYNYSIPITSIRAIYEKRTFTYISKNYNILKHAKSFSLYSLDLVHDVCKLMEIPNWSYNSIILYI